MTAEKIIEIIESVLNDDMSSLDGIALLKNLKNTEGNKINCAIRLLKSYNTQAYYDFCGHLRQVIVFYGYPIAIGNKVFFQFVFNNLASFGLSIIGDEDNKKITANSKILPGSKLETIYKYEKRSKEKLSIGDGRLYNYTGYKSYRTFSQKILLNKISNCNYGDTMLACLPTGAGKSLSWQLPGISNEYPGLIIVIVPTVALAINHQNASKKMFENLNISDVYPKAYYSGCTYEQKSQIKKEILNGTLPILYISPEALMQKDFKEMIMEASRLGKISMLVIDECHLIPNWGGGFRPEFQLIPSFRNAINEICKIKTILLSATLTDNDISVLKNIFNNDGNFIEFHADALRPEISYKLDFYQNPIDRLNMIKKLILQAPRPIIVYASTILSAENIFNTIKSTGLKNVELYTSHTRNQEEIIKKWDRDDIDIIVATSAFGMGVDKSDIRSIIHTFIPENISRFYQESGRAGRDGYSAIDFSLISLKEDKKDVDKLLSNAILTSDSIVNRWFDLKSNSSVVDGDCMWIDTHTTPNHLLKNITGEQSASWNKATIMFLYRNGFIDIIDLSIRSKNEYLIKIKLLKRKELENKERLLAVIDCIREDERAFIENGIQNSLEMLKNTACFGAIFKNEYKYAEEICSGCPYCDKHKIDSYYISSTIKVINKTPVDNLPVDDLDKTLQNNKESLLTCDSYDLDYSKVLSYLIDKGVRNFILPNLSDEKLIDIYKSVALYRNINNILIFDNQEFSNNNVASVITGTVCVVLDDEIKYQSKIFKFAEKYGKIKGNNVVFISKDNVIDNRYGKVITSTEKFPLGKIENILGGRNDNF